MTELDDLKSAWQTLSRTLERQNALALAQFRENKRPRFRSGFRPLVIGQIFQIIAGALLVLWGANFWGLHLGIAHLMTYGVSLHAYGVMMIIFAGRDLHLIKQMDYAAPVLTLQKQIAALRQWHLRTGMWFGVTGCFIWIPLLLMIFHALGADVWVRKPEVVGWFLVNGFAALAVLLGIVFWSRRRGREKLAKNLDDGSAGRSVSRAQALLDEIAHFERE